ncbi:MAG: response regulator transcription factor [Bacteroidota bacterium]
MQLKIGILDDEIIICETLKRYILQMGYVCDYAISFQEAVALNDSLQPDLFLLDINLNGTKTGIDFGHQLRANSPSVPIIFISSYSDAESISAASAVQPDAYLIKPINENSIRAAVEIALSNYLSKRKMEVKKSSNKDFLFVKQDSFFVKIQFKDLFFIKSDGVYLELYTTDKKYLVRETINGMLEQLGEQFIQVHRSYVVNIEHVHQFNSEELKVQNQLLPIGKNYKELLFQHLK